MNDEYGEIYMLSIIVPVYNTEKYLNDCIKSILSQTYQNFELLLIDDGSTDKSGYICDLYAEKDKRVKVVHKKNAGVVSARDDGIQLACGEYIAFIDSDDWIDKEYFTYYMSMFDQDVDIIVTGIVRNENERIFNCVKLLYMTREEALKEMMERKKIGWELCGKIYRAELLRYLDMDTAIVNGEDLDRNWKIFKKINKIVVDSNKNYHYRRNYASETMNHIPLRSNLYLVYHHIMDDGGLRIRDVAPIIYSQYLGTIFVRIRELFFYKPKGYINIVKKHLMDINKYSSMISDNITIISAKYESILNGFDKCCDFFFKGRNILEKSVEKPYKNYGIDYIYGTGKVAHYVSYIMKKNNWEYKAYIVSEGENKREYFYDKPVYGIECLKENDSVLVAVGKKNEKIIIKKLQCIKGIIVNIVDTEMFS